MLAPRTCAPHPDRGTNFGLGIRKPREARHACLAAPRRRGSRRMDDEEPARRSDAAAALTREDLSAYSVGDLQDRVDRLEAEIERCRRMLAAKEDSRAAAESVFRT